MLQQGAAPSEHGVPPPFAPTRGARPPSTGVFMPSRAVSSSLPSMHPSDYRFPQPCMGTPIQVPPAESDDAALLSFVHTVEQASHTLHILQLRVYAWELRASLLQNYTKQVVSGTENMSQDGEQFRASMAQDADMEGEGSSVEHCQMKVREMEEGLSRFLSLIREDLPPQIAKLQKATHALHQQMTMSLDSAAKSTPESESLPAPWFLEGGGRPM
mmetsp:Transcript_61169/g.157760  ORF Transcript_61169/g.157760 Transcript_61169/m.157760 type:complete len:215 (-) Transcript_61169:161-805(-)